MFHLRERPCRPWAKVLTCPVSGADHLILQIIISQIITHFFFFCRSPSAKKHSQQDLQQFSPIINNNLTCVGGWLQCSNQESGESYPTVLPKDSHGSLLLILHHRKQVKHQGFHLREGAIRVEGLWILGVESLINSVLYNCITCGKLRRKVEEQYRPELPPECLHICFPFRCVGLDFGPWSVAVRWTRRQAENKWRETTHQMHMYPVASTHKDQNQCCKLWYFISYMFKIIY